MRWFAFLLLAGLSLIGLLFAAPSARAYSCQSPPPPKEAMEKMNAVFSAKAVTVEADEKGLHQVRVTFEVSRVWKGQAGKTVVVVTGDNGGACGFTFHEGEGYLVYAYDHEGTLHTNICTRTKVLAHAREDLDALGEGKAVDAAPAATQPATKEAAKREFVTLDRIPSPGEVLEMRNQDGRTFVAADGTLPEKFRKVLETAKPLDGKDKSLRTWAYSPNGSGTFKTKEGTYHYLLFLGGRGQLQTPSGKVGMFSYEFPTTQAAVGAAAAVLAGAAPPSLRVRIAVPERDVVVARDDRSHFDVVIENVSDRPQKLIDEWNSWGYFSLHFEYTTAKGEKRVMKKVGRGWDKNFLTTTTLKPAEVLVREVYLDKTIWDNLPAPEQGEESVTIRAIFAQDDAPAAAWHGTVTSADQQVVFRKVQP